MKKLRREGRDPGGVTLVGVGKRQPPEFIAQAIEAGLTDLGESYLQEARRKFPLLPAVRKHFIGHIQSNKAKAIAATFDVVQSVDRAEAGVALGRAAQELGATLPVLLQLNITPSDRFGCRPDRGRPACRNASRPGEPAPRGRHGNGTAGRRQRRNIARIRARCQDLGTHRWKYAFHRYVGRLARSAASRLDDGAHRRGALWPAHRWEAHVSVFSKIGSFFSIRDDEDEFYEDEVPSGRVVPLSTAGRRGGTQVSVYSPRSYQDVVEIADSLRNRQVVIMNLQNADRTLLQRVVDFTSGVAYTIDGKIQKLAESIYLVVPAGIVVNAAGLRDSMMADGTFDFMGNRP